MPTNNLDITYLVANQNQPEVPVNAAVDQLELALTEQYTHDMASDADYTLSTGSPEEWRYAILEITDTGVVLTASSPLKSIIFPTNKKLYVVVNSTAQPLIFRTSAGAGVTVGAGNTAIVRCDGTDILRVTADA